MFHGSVPFGSSLKFLLSSGVQVSAVSNTSTFHETGQIHFQAMAQTPTARTAAFSAIDKEIDTERQLIRSLLSRRNTLAPISALPPELLSRIFHFHAQDERLYGQPLGWIWVTHVCQHWRQVALNDSSLWATITGSLPRERWISEMLVRARKVPLVIDIVGLESQSVLAQLPPHIPRTRELRLRSLSMLHSQGVREICALEAPTLEHFELGISESVGPITFREFVGTTLFKGQAPKLRTFSLAQISIPWSLIPRGQLTQLEITDYDDYHGGIFNTDGSLLNDLNQFIDLLIDSPDLEVLVLKHCLPTTLSEVSHGQPIHLSRLSRLSLGGPTASITNLLKMLKLPSSATLHLRCISENSSTHHVNVILPLVSAHFHNSTPVEFKSFRVTVDHLEHLIDVAASIATTESPIFFSPVREGVMEGTAELNLTFHCELPEFRELIHTDILGQLCSMLPISNLEFLSISASDTIQSVNWYNIFQRCKNVTTIQAKGCGTIGFLQALAPPKVTDTMARGKGKKRKRGKRATQVQAANNSLGVRATPTAFPKLTSLFLEDLNLAAAVPDHGVLYDILMNAIQWRKTNKIPLETLAVVFCAITARPANSLKKHVEKFSWNGEECATDDEWVDDLDLTLTFLDLFPDITQAEWGWFANFSP